MASISEQFGIVNGIKAADLEAGSDTDSIDAGLVKRLLFIFNLGALTGDAVLTINSGASAGTKTTAETFRYKLASADQGAANSDQYGAWATSAGLTLTAATYDNRLLLAEIDSDMLTEGQPWVTGNLSDAASALLGSCTIIAEPRYEGHNPPSII